MRNATEKDVQLARQWKVLQTNVMYGYGPLKVHGKRAFNPALHCVVETNTGYLACLEQWENLHALKTGPAQTPKKPRRTPKKGTRPEQIVPFKYTGLRVGDTVIHRDGVRSKVTQVAYNPRVPSRWRWPVVTDRYGDRYTYDINGIADVNCLIGSMDLKYIVRPAKTTPVLPTAEDVVPRREEETAKYTVVSGNFVDGLELYGTFDNEKDAIEYGNSHLCGNWFIIKMQETATCAVQRTPGAPAEHHS